MMRFVRKHVRPHGGAGRPRGHPGVAGEFLHAALAIIGKGIHEHLEAQAAAFLVGGGGLFHGAAMAVERSWPLEMRRGIAEPVEAYVVQMGEDRREGASAAAADSGRLSAPDAAIEVRKQELIHGVIDGVDFQQVVSELYAIRLRYFRHSASTGGLILLVAECILLRRKRVRQNGAP